MSAMDFNPETQRSEYDYLTEQLRRTERERDTLRGVVASIAEAFHYPDDIAIKLIRAELGRLTVAVMLTFTAAACGYSEAEMQAQRDKTTNIVNALDRLAQDDAQCRIHMDTLTKEIAALRSELGQ
jgi:hypothetical protein